MTCSDKTKKCEPGGGCGAQEFEIEAIPPNVYLSLDRSCSMTGIGTGSTSKWKIAVDAIKKMTTDFKGEIRWGLGLFPDIKKPACAQAASAFAVAPNNEAKIQQLLTAALAKSHPQYPDGPLRHQHRYGGPSSKPRAGIFRQDTQELCPVDH